jgi:hypothetical protein
MKRHISIAVLFISLSGCSARDEMRTHDHAWKLVLQSQMSFSTQAKKQSKCNLAEESEYLDSTKRAFLLLRPEHVFSFRSSDPNQQEILLRDDKTVIKLNVKTENGNCKTFEIWQILE